MPPAASATRDGQLLLTARREHCHNLACWSMHRKGPDALCTRVSTVNMQVARNLLMQLFASLVLPGNINLFQVVLCALHAQALVWEARRA